MLVDDFRSAVRSVARARTLTAVLLISLGLGTGANAAVYGVVNALLFRAPAGISGASRLTSIYTTQYDGRKFGPSSWPDFLSVSAGSRSFEIVAAIDDRAVINVRLGDHFRSTRLAAVSGDFFALIRMRAHTGRLLHAGDAAAVQPVAVISFSLWDAAGRPDVSSLTLSVLDRDHRVVGVGPPLFRGLHAGRFTDVWVPLHGDATERTRGDRRLSVLGRLRPGTTIDAADAELNRVSDALAQRSPSTNRGTQAQPDLPRRISTIPYSPLEPESRQQISLIAGVVIAAVARVLVSAGGNAGNLLLSRGFARRRQLAVKMALGATRGRLVRQLLTESLLISLGGAALGLLFAAWTSTVIPSLFSPDHAALLDTSLPTGLILATVAIACVAGALFGVAPAFHATSSSPSLALRADSGGVSEEQGGRTLRAVLVAAQVALSTVLMLGAALLITSLREVLNADRAFPARNVAVVVMESPGRFIDPVRGLSFHRTLTQTLLKMPGVQTAGWSSIAPLIGATQNEFRIEAGAAEVTDAVELDVNVVTRGYFGALGVRLVEGRLFDDRDQALTTPVVIVDEQLARRYFGAIAVGQHLIDGRGDRLEIVGVVRRGKFRTLQESPRPTVYYPLAQNYVAQGNLFVVVHGDASDMVAALPNIMRRIDDGVVVRRVMRFDEYLTEALAIDRLTSTLVAVCGLIALVLAVIGVYGVMNDAVQRRTREIGLRVALGAARSQVAKLVFLEALYVSVSGLIAGTLLALLASRAVGTFIGALPGWSVTTISAPPTLLAVVVALAAVSPLRKALSVSAAVALRGE
jgi:predicted permease